MGCKRHPGLVCGAGYLPGVPDLSPESHGHQGHLEPTPRCASGRSCGWSWTCWFKQSIPRNGQSNSILPVQETMIEKEKIDSLKPKLWRGRDRNSDIVPFVQQPSCWRFVTERTWDCFLNLHQLLGRAPAP